MVGRPQGVGRWGERGRRWWGAWGDDGGAEGSGGRCGDGGVAREDGLREVGLALWADGDCGGIGGVLRPCRPCCQLGASALDSGPTEGVQRGCVVRGRPSCSCGPCPPACPACGARALRALSSPEAPRSSTATSLRPCPKPTRARYGRATRPVLAGSRPSVPWGLTLGLCTCSPPLSPCPGPTHARPASPWGPSGGCTGPTGHREPSAAAPLGTVLGVDPTSPPHGDSLAWGL